MADTKTECGASWFAPSNLEACDADRVLFDRELRAFVPPDAFDAHAHLYRAEDLDGVRWPTLEGPVGLEAYRRLIASWMGDRAARDGLFFGMPERNVDTSPANDFELAEVRASAGSRVLLLARPSDAPSTLEELVRTSGGVVAGFKVYHVYASRDRTMDARVEEFLPEWMGEIANRHELAIMLHLVRDRALADPVNQSSIREFCIRFPHAKLILAHAARGFCAAHTQEGIASLRGLENVFFDTSAICEPLALQAILETFGTRRLFYGSDFPVSNLRGRAVSLGDRFFWLYAHNVDWGGDDNHVGGKPTLVGIESLLALRQACRALHLRDADVERIFRTNALRELGLSLPTGTFGEKLYAHAKRIIPGGTQLLSKRPEMHAPERWPPYFAEARGIEVVDTDGRAFLDFSLMGVGSCLLGYADPDVNAAVARRVTLGSMAMLNPADEVELADALLELHPWAGGVRYARSGGEALTIAVRIARASTGRDAIAFCGYHGWHDWYIASNIATAGANDADRLAGHLLPGLEPAGVPTSLAGSATPFSYNRLDELETIVTRRRDELAAIVMEPTRNEPPEPGFLEGVRALADEIGALLIVDEVSAGWRLHLGGAHLRYGLSPDMAVFSKALGNGYPIAAIVGTARAMAAAERTFISSTLWTEGIGPAAALATIAKLRRFDVPAHVDAVGVRYREGIDRLAERFGVPIRVCGHPALTTIAFEHERSAALQTLLTVRMLDRGYLSGAGFYPSLAHEPRHVDAYLAAADSVFEELGDAIRADDVERRLDSPPKHTGFRRLA